jgi:hypothetical protein
MSVLHVRRLAPQEVRELRRRGLYLRRPPRPEMSREMTRALLADLTARLRRTLPGLLAKG